MGVSCDKLCASDFRTRILVQDEITTDDGYGGQTVVFNTVVDGFAKVETKRGFEDFSSQAIRARNTYRMTMRWNSLITPKMRVTWKGKVGNITDVDNVEERDVYLELTVEENIGE